MIIQLQCHAPCGDIQVNTAGDLYGSVDLTQSTSDANQAPTPTFTYSIKILNPSKKTDFIIQKLRISRHFTSVDDIKAQIVSSCEGKVPEDLEQLGYMSPGNQKKRWLFTDDDIKDMYREYSGKKEILLWCHGKGKPDEGKTSKRSCPDSETGTKGSKVPRTTNYEMHRQKLDEVQEIREDLMKRHAGKYTPEQLGAWAHLLQMGRHDSRDTPPDLPYWKKKGKKSKNSSPSTDPTTTCNSTPSLPSPASSATGSISPGKRITLRKWHSCTVFTPL